MAGTMPRLWCLEYDGRSAGYEDFDRKRKSYHAVGIGKTY